MPNALSRIIKNIGLTVFGGAIASGVIAGGIFLNKISTTGGETPGAVMPSDYTAAFLPVIIDITATGSTTAKSGLAYDAYCGPSPLQSKFGAGSGFIIRYSYHNVYNPAAVGGYVGFVDDCGAKSQSGAQLFTSLPTATGATKLNGTGSHIWPGSGSGDNLKITLTGVPTDSFDAKFIIWLEDIQGE